MPASGLLFLIVFVTFGAILAFTGARDSVRLSAGSITVTRGKVTTTLALPDIASLASRFVWDSPRAGHWALIISAYSGGMIELGMAQGAYLAIFVDPLIREYAATGRIWAG